MRHSRSALLAGLALAGLYAGAGLARGDEDKPPPPYTLVKLTLRPAAEPSPALRFQLLPAARDLTPGNAAMLYYRAFSPEWLSHRRDNQQMNKVYEYTQKPVAELPVKELHWLHSYRPLQEVDRAARRSFCDWELGPRLREDGVNLLLPEVQAFREFASLLALRARLEIAEGHFDKAVATLQTGFALARHVAEGPTLIHFLVGSAIAAVMTQQLETLIEQPGAPNMYWALTSLPQPLTDIRKSIDAEMQGLDSMFPDPKEVAAMKGSPERINARLEESFAKLAAYVGDGGPEAVKSLTVFGAMTYYPDAKKLLIADGRPKDEVEAMPVLQVVTLAGLKEYHRLRDEMFKWQGLPYPLARAGVTRAERQIAELRRGPGIVQQVYLSMLPAVAKVMFAGVRTERRLAALRCVEAVRLYAAAHGGKPPAALADVTDVPVPDDPVTGKPFEYRAEGGRVILSAPAPTGEVPNQSNALRYELTFKQ